MTSPGLAGNRCLWLLIVAVSGAGLVWLGALALITAIYHGNAGDVLNPLITGQANHPLARYQAEFNRLYRLACAAALLPLLVCSLLPATLRARLRSLAAGLLRNLKDRLSNRRRITVLAVTLLAVCGLLVLFSPGHSPTARIPDAYEPGQSRLLAGPDGCDGQHCYELEVSCPELGSAEKVALQVMRPAGGTPEKGTIVFLAGWTGNFWWSGDSGPDATLPPVTDPDVLRIIANHRMILSALQAAGYQTVQVKWERGWLVADTGLPENPPLLACKPATVMRWVHDNLHHPSSERAFCATGHSNGATQLAYLLSRYNMDDILSLVIMEAGPNMARLDYACIEHAAHHELFDTPNGRSTIDLAFGYPNDGSGICARRDADFMEYFRRTSVAVDSEWSYYYPDTLVTVITGGDDDTVTSRHAEYYHAWLARAGTPLLTMARIPGTGHVPSGDTAGAALMRDTLLNECRPRTSR